MDLRHRTLLEQGNQLFDKRGTLLTLWQEIADNFYPERADFTVTRSLGMEFAANLDTSYPILARRDLGNAFSAMLRPSEKNWFTIRPNREEKETDRALKWLEMAEQTQRRAMYDRVSQFVRATKEGDNDFAAFGQCVLSVELNRYGNALLYRCWHLRDVAWCENHEGKVDTVHRKWKPTIQTLQSLFKNLAPQINDEMLRREPYKEIECRHIIIPSEGYEAAKNADGAQGQKWKTPYVSIHLDVENEHVMEEVGVWNPMYVIPRWQTVSGSQYAFSPATVAALPDARLIQAMSYVIVNAGEKAVDPPMIATQEAVRSDVQIFAGGITWIDAEYDERLGEALRPIPADHSGLSMGLEMVKDTREMIKEAFFLNRLSMPPANQGNMTAFEVGQRIQEYIRNALPLFEPMENDYNGAICEITFDLLLRGGAFGPVDLIPPEIRGSEVQFRFESPLREAAERMKGQTFLQTKQMIAEAAPLDPMAPAMFDARTALRDALRGVGTPAKWLRSEQQVAAIEQGQQKEQAMQKLLGTISQGADVAQKVGNAAEALASSSKANMPQGPAVP